jgi:hypothetical protein
VIFLCRVFDETALGDPLYPFLRFALWGPSTAFLLAAQWFIELFPIRDQKIQECQTISKEHFDESYLLQPDA